MPLCFSHMQLPAVFCVISEHLVLYLPDYACDLEFSIYIFYNVFIAT